MNHEQLGGKELLDKIYAGMSVYSDKTFLERFGVFMGKVQLLEFGLKKILVSLPGFALKQDELETKSLGQTRVELERLGLRSDYNSYLKNFVKQRNKMAHEFLANYAITQHLMAGARLIRSFERELDNACFSLEQLILVFDFINGANDITAWVEPKPINNLPHA